MGKYKSLMLLGIAVVIAFFTSLLIYGYIRGKGRVKEVRLEVQPVVVAAIDLSWGTRITNEMVKKVNFLKGSLTTGYFSDPASVVGRVLIYPVKMNEPILESRLAPTEVKTGGIAAVITPRKRAVAVKVDRVIGVSGFVHPGNRVDVLMTLATGRTFNPVTKTILENVLVLAVGPETKEKKGLEERASPAEVITLEVTPEEAEKLALAATEGKLQLALRNFGDMENTVTRGTTVSSLLGPHALVSEREERPAVKREAEAQKPVVQPIIHEEKRLENPVQKPAEKPIEKPSEKPIEPPAMEKVEKPRPSIFTVELIKGSKISEVKFEGSE